jgi:transcriptional regulator with GAF, ATPase, and Fis domain
MALDDDLSGQTTQVVYPHEQAPQLVLATAALRVVAGPNAGVGCPLELRRVRVGSDPDNDLVLSDAQVSRHHLELRVEDRGYRIVDLGSTNGTFLGGGRIREALLELGGTVRLGATSLRVEPGPSETKTVAPSDGFGRLVGGTRPMRELYGLLQAVAPSDVTVLLEGETGAGKELVAEEIHRHSPRGSKMFLVVDCGALSATLVESELFGHERGAFTGAVGERKGAFERADGGTVFLDEVGELPLELQTRLLRVFDRRTVRRVGGDLDRHVDVRLVAATNRDLQREVREGAFRRDLYYRLAVVRIVVPPLRDRRADVLPLARHFLWEDGCAQPETVLTPEVVERLTARSWPGNVRELRNALQRAWLLASASSPDATALVEPPELESPLGDGASAAGLDAVLAEILTQPYRQAKDRLLDEFDRVYAERLTERHGGNISSMAREAGVDRQVIRRLLAKREP